MVFNLNEFLTALSFALDFVEMDIVGVTSNHGKRTAYISLCIAGELGLSREAQHDIVALSILHDNGVSEKSLHDSFIADKSAGVGAIERIKEHCTIGEINAGQYPFLTEVKGTILFHHERYDGEGFFGLAGKEIPLLSQIIFIVDTLELCFDLKHIDGAKEQEILNFTKAETGSLFSPQVVEAFHSAVSRNELWRNLSDEHVDQALKAETPQISKELSLEEVHRITGVFSRIIDSKSQYTQRHSRDLAEKVASMADFYKMGHEEKLKLVIAADLHDVGKLAVPNDILDVPRTLTKEEFELVKKHALLTRQALQEIKGFEDITEWAANHHEKLNGGGYPFGKMADELDFNSRLMACLDIYQALTEERPYRKALDHAEAMEILYKMSKDGLLDEKITEDIDRYFSI